VRPSARPTMLAERARPAATAELTSFTCEAALRHRAGVCHLQGGHKRVRRGRQHLQASHLVSVRRRHALVLEGFPTVLPSAGATSASSTSRPCVSYECYLARPWSRMWSPTLLPAAGAGVSAAPAGRTSRASAPAPGHRAGCVRLQCCLYTAGLFLRNPVPGSQTTGEVVRSPAEVRSTSEVGGRGPTAEPVEDGPSRLPARRLGAYLEHQAARPSALFGGEVAALAPLAGSPSRGPLVTGRPRGAEEGWRPPGPVCRQKQRVRGDHLGEPV